MFKKLAVIAASLAFAALPVGGASAGPPEQIDSPDFFQLFLDVDEGKSAWINITAVDFCNWASGGFEGLAPVQDTSVPVTLNFNGPGDKYLTPSANLRDVYIEVWDLDNPDGPFVNACEDILDQLLGGGSPWATGTTSFNGKLSNVTEAEPRAFAARANGTALLDETAGDGGYRYHFNLHGNNRCADFRCDVTNTSLRMN